MIKKQNLGNTNGFKKGQPSWNKGIKTKTNSGKTHFKKNSIPWNKGTKGVMKAWNKGIPNLNGRGDKCYSWKGGVTPENEKIRKSLEIKLWKKACMERDDFTCQKTGQRGGRLAVHHINNFADFPELRTSIENGVTLAMELHIEFHKKYGYKHNTKEQLIEFLNK